MEIESLSVGVSSFPPCYMMEGQQQGSGVVLPESQYPQHQQQHHPYNNMGYHGGSGCVSGVGGGDYQYQQYFPNQHWDAQIPPMYLPPCNNYTHHYGGHGSNTGYTSHYHHGGGQFMGSSTSMTATCSKMTASLPPPQPSRMPWSTSSEMLAYPGGLEIVWREVPEDCQKIITMQDVPDTARLRGYFTVCELLILKRNLLGRLRNMEAERSESEAPEESVGVGVGVAATQAMNTLDNAQQSTHQSQSEEQSDKFGLVRPKSPLVELQPDCIKDENDVTDNEILSSTTSPSPRTSDTATIITTASMHSNCATTSKYSCVTSSSTFQEPISSYLSPPPAYRTATLVFKLLLIGNYQIRSFSEISPNRLRVLFNTQRITYECHLTLVKPRDATHGNVRKLLTVDIGFDQISMLRFGCNKLFLKVDGSPGLSVSYSPAETDNTCPPITDQDRSLLDQIEKGQLKLSPCHQIYFINERLVHLLEAQFKQHPRFRHIIQHNAEPYGPYHAPPDQNQQRGGFGGVVGGGGGDGPDVKC